MGYLISQLVSREATCIRSRVSTRISSVSGCVLLSFQLQLATCNTTPKTFDLRVQVPLQQHHWCNGPSFFNSSILRSNVSTQNKNIHVPDSNQETKTKTTPTTDNRRTQTNVFFLLSRSHTRHPKKPNTNRTLNPPPPTNFPPHASTNTFGRALHVVALNGCFVFQSLCWVQV